jgi:hypothetical protein
VPTGAARILWRLEALCTTPAPPSPTPPPMLLIIGDKFVDETSAASMLAIDCPAHEPLRLGSDGDLPLFDRHGGGCGGSGQSSSSSRSTSAVSSSIVLNAIIDAVRPYPSPAADDHRPIPAAPSRALRARPLMDFDVAALLVGMPLDSPLALAAADAFESRLGNFGAAEYERLLTCLGEMAEDEDAMAVCATSGGRRRRGPQPPPPPHVSLSLLTRIILVGGCSWHDFLPVRWCICRRLARAPDADAIDAINVATRCFTRRLTLSLLEWEASETLFARWLHACVGEVEVVAASEPSSGKNGDLHHHGQQLGQGDRPCSTCHTSHRLQAIAGHLERQLEALAGGGGLRKRKRVA